MNNTASSYDKIHRHVQSPIERDVYISDDDILGAEIDELARQFQNSESMIGQRRKVCKYIFVVLLC